MASSSRYSFSAVLLTGYAELFIELTGKLGFVGDIRFDLFRIGVIVGERGVHLREVDVRIFARNFLRSHAHLTPDDDPHHRDASAGDLRPAAPDLGIAVDQRSDLDGVCHTRIVSCYGSAKT